MRAEITAFTASLLINAAILGSFERAVTQYDSRLTAQREQEEKIEKLGGLQFEFVEAPAKTAPRKPEKTKKVSDRDSVAQDTTQDKENISPQTPPKIENEGPADQLEQRRLEPSQVPSPASKPSASQLPSVFRTKEDEAKEEKKPAWTEKNEISDPSKAQAQMMSVAQAPSLPSPASLPQALVQGLTGADRINTQAISRTNSHGAQLYGATSFEATGSGMGQYMKNMKDKIWLAWFPYLAFHYPKDFRSADAVVEFTINASGEVRMVKLVDSQGSPIFAAFCVEAVQRAGIFGPLPEEILDLMGKDELEVKFAFHFW
jgi:TonB family protein